MNAILAAPGGGRRAIERRHLHGILVGGYPRSSDRASPFGVRSVVIRLMLAYCRIRYRSRPPNS